MKVVKLSVAAAMLLVGSATAFADTVENVNFTYSDPTAGNVTTGQVLAGTGSLNSSLFVATNGTTPLGTQAITLVTASSTNINGGPYADGSFQWQDSDGTNIVADTAFSLTAPYVDTNGLLFAVGSPNSGGKYGSFNFYDNGTGSVLGDFLGHGGNPGQGQVYNTSSDGTLVITSITAVPLPASAWLLISGLGGLGALSRRRRIAWPGRT
jgi:hypothetical protein